MTQTITTTPAPQPPARAHDETPRALGQAEGMWLIASREIRTSLRSPAVVWSLISMLLLVALGVFGGRYLGDVMENVFGGGDIKVGTTATAEQLPPSAVDGELVQIASVEEGLQQVRDGELDAVVLSGQEASGITLHNPDGSEVPAERVSTAPTFVIIGNETVPDSLVQGLTIPPVSGTLTADTEKMPDFAYMFVALGFGIVFFIVVMLYSQRLSQSIVEEKASRIVELIVSTVKPSTILAGKLLGGTILALIQVGLLAAVLVGSLAITGQLGVFPEVSGAILWFAPLAILGFMFYSSLYAALSSTVSRSEDVASATAPMTYLLMVPYLLPMFGYKNDVLMTWLSYLPFSSPVAMPVRLVMGNAQWWEPILAAVVLLASVAGVIWIAGRIYHNSVLRTGSKVKLSEALRGS